MKKRRSFTLLEVLIALLLITTALPMLISPYFHEMIHSTFYKKAMQREEQKSMLQVAFFEALHYKKLKLADTLLDKWNEVDPSWLPQGFPKASYKFIRIKPEKIAEQPPKVELWALILKWQDDKNEQKPLYIVLEK